jgi:hypothetical protein
MFRIKEWHAALRGYLRSHLQDAPFDCGFAKHTASSLLVQMIAPKVEELAGQTPDVRFAKVNPWERHDTSIIPSQCLLTLTAKPLPLAHSQMNLELVPSSFPKGLEIKALPTFHAYVKGNKVDQVCSCARGGNLGHKLHPRHL